MTTTPKKKAPVRTVPKQLEETKVRVGAQSEKIQKALFRLGYRWFFNSREIRHADAPFLFLYPDGQLAYGLDEEFYRDSRFREIEPARIFTLSSTL